MYDYSDLLLTMGALIIVGMLINTANQTMVLNDRSLYSNEYETAVTAIAQDILEESRALSFDEETVTGFVPVNIPDDFSTLGPDGESDRIYFDDFDDYDGYTTTISTYHGDFDISVEVNYLDNNQDVTYSKSTLKGMNITITNQVLFNNDIDSLSQYTFSYIRSYYAD